MTTSSGLPARSRWPSWRRGSDGTGLALRPALEVLGFRRWSTSLRQRVQTLPVSEARLHCSNSGPRRPVTDNEQRGGAARRLAREDAALRDSADRGLSRATAATCLGLLAGAAAAWTVVAWLLARRWPWEPFGSTASQSDVLKIALGVVAAGGAAVALVVNYRRQLHLERDEAGRRDQIRLLTERFGAAAAQLGGEQAAVRLAGVYAMSALADEWADQRQQCVNVLCGYLRLPYSGEQPPGHPHTVTELRQYAGGTVQRTQTTTYRPGEEQVRRAIVETIHQHLQPAAVASWSALDFDFNGATLVDVDFTGARRQAFSRRVLSLRCTDLGSRCSGVAGSSADGLSARGSPGW